MSLEIPSKVLVSMTDNKNRYATDIELPSQMRINELTKGILRLLKEFEPTIYSGYDSAELWVDNLKLRDDQTLASAGIWDGSEISLNFPSRWK